MPLELIATIVGTGIGIIVAMGALILTLFLWNRSESNTDRRHFDVEIKQMRRDLIDAVREIKKEIENLS